VPGYFTSNTAVGGIGCGGGYVHTVTFGTSTPVSNLRNVAMVGNSAIGGTGGAGGNGGDGGNGQGGAVRDLLGTINVSQSLLAGNEAVGGSGGAAGAGGVGGNRGSDQGGGLLTGFGVTAVLSDSALLGNLAEGHTKPSPEDSRDRAAPSSNATSRRGDRLSLVHSLKARADRRSVARSR
jgi:hypothetical protein